ncbi:hypothetical protein L198_00002, partial [Cryptococcus wingfieldii CBS 7118]
AAQTGQERMRRKGLALGCKVIEAREDEGELFGAAALGFLSSFIASEPAEGRPQCFVRKVTLGYCRRHSSGLDETTVNETWASEAGERGEVEELHERLQSHLQHYTEPSPANVGTTTYAGVGPLVTTWLWYSNAPGIPIVVVCLRRPISWIMLPRMWECKMVPLGFTLQPTTYALLKWYLLHRLCIVPPPLNTPPVSAPAIVGSTKFPFNHLANVLDRDAVMVLYWVASLAPLIHCPFLRRGRTGLPCQLRLPHRLPQRELQRPPLCPHRSGSPPHRPSRIFSCSYASVNSFTQRVLDPIEHASSPGQETWDNACAIDDIVSFLCSDISDEQPAFMQGQGKALSERGIVTVVCEGERGCWWCGARYGL